MSDNDLIRRGDVAKAITTLAQEFIDGGSPTAAHVLNLASDRINATLPAAQVTVKPLEWFEGDEPDEWKSGPYDVWCELGKYQVYYWSIVMGEPHETAKAAKAAAQADYDARIRSALTVTPHDPAKVQALVGYYRASESIAAIEHEWRTRKAEGGLLSGPNILNLTDKLTAAETRLFSARAALAAWKEG